MAGRLPNTNLEPKRKLNVFHDSHKSRCHPHIGDNSNKPKAWEC